MKKVLLYFVLLWSPLVMNAQSWTELGGTAPGIGLNANSDIYSIISDPSGNIYATGHFWDANGHFYVAKYDGNSWLELGGTTTGIALNPNNQINTIASDPSGNIYAGGDFTDGNGFQYVAKWNGTSWTELGGTAPGTALNANGNLKVYSDVSGNIYAAGSFTNTYSNTYVAKWNGSAWLQLVGTTPGITFNATINTLTSDQLGNIYVAGEFYDANGNYFVAKWDGTSWTELGGTTPGIALNANQYIFSISSDPSGNIYAAGNFTDGKGNPYVAKWDGSTWSEVGGTATGISLNANGFINSLTSDQAGNIYAGGNFSDVNGKRYVAKYDGNGWTEVGGTTSGAGINANVEIFTIYSNATGNIYAGGYFTDANGKYYVAKWDGTTSTVTGIASNVEAVKSLSIYPNPTNDNVTLNTLEEGSLAIYSSRGELVAIQFVSFGTTNIALGNFSSGIYTLLFSGQNKGYPPIKIVKE